MRPGVTNVATGAALVLAAVALLGASNARPAQQPLAATDVTGGRVTLESGRADLQGPNAVGYLVARNTSDEPVQLVAITSPDAASVNWTMKRQVVTLADLFSTGSVCSPDAALQQAANQQIRDLRNLYVPAHGSLILRHGTGSLTFSDVTPTLHRGTSIQIQVYLVGASVPAGSTITAALPTA